MFQSTNGSVIKSQQVLTANNSLLDHNLAMNSAPSHCKANLAQLMQTDPSLSKCDNTGIFLNLFVKLTTIE